MANDYYTSTSLTRNTQAKAEDINARTESVEAGFEKLPDPHASAPTTKGFSEVFKIKDATGVDHPVAAGQIQGNDLIYAADSGTANAYVVTLAPALAAYAAGVGLVMKATNSNTGASTINVNALGAKSIKSPSGAALSADDIVGGGMYTLLYDGTNFQLFTILTTTATVLDEDDMSSDSATSVPSQQSTKAYVDSTSVSVSSKTTDYQLLTADLYGDKTFDNNGAGAEVECTWAALAAGQKATFMVTDAQYVKIIAASGKKIRIGAIQTAADGYIRSNTVGNWVTLQANADDVVVLDYGGIWNYDQ